MITYQRSESGTNSQARSFYCLVEASVPGFVQFVFQWALQDTRPNRLETDSEREGRFATACPVGAR